MITDLGILVPVNEVEHTTKTLLTNLSSVDEYGKSSDHFEQVTVYENEKFNVDVSGTIIPYLHSIASRQGYVKSSSIRTIYPGTKGPVHTDDCMCLHFSLTDSPEMSYHFGNDVYTMEQGKFYLFDATKEHWVENKGTAKRLNYHIWLTKNKFQRISTVW